MGETTLPAASHSRKKAAGNLLGLLERENMKALLTGEESIPRLKKELTKVQAGAQEAIEPGALDALVRRRRGIGIELQHTTGAAETERLSQKSAAFDAIIQACKQECAVAHGHMGRQR